MATHNGAPYTPPARHDKIHFTLNMTPGTKDRLNGVSHMLGCTQSELLRRLIDIVVLPDRLLNQRLCICEGDRKVAEIAGI